MIFITEINGKRLKKPLEVKVSISYIAEVEDPEFFGDGETEEEAVEDLKSAIEGMYRFFKEHEDEFGAEEQKKQILGLFE